MGEIFQNVLSKTITSTLNFTRNAQFGHIQREFSRRFASCGGTKKGLVLGAYEGCEPGELKLTPTGQRFDEDICCKLSDLLKGSGLKKGKAVVFGNLGEGYTEVAVAGLGPEGERYRSSENLEVCKENIRIASGVGAKVLQERGMNVVEVEPFTHPEPAAEGAALSLFRYQDLRNKDNQVNVPKLEMFPCGACGNKEQWMRGYIKAEAQNVARKLEEAPSNLMTPAMFCQTAIEILCPCGLFVEVRGRDWIEAQRMTAFLAMARGSCEPPMFLEMTHCGGEVGSNPVVLVGKGVTFDSGGLNLKACQGMKEYRADLAGAAVVLATLKAAAQMNLPINIRGMIPLSEHGMGGLGMKPGDVVMSMNGKTIRIENTDNEGRLAVADVLHYATMFKPCLAITVADFTTGLKEAMGEAASGIFSTSEEIWEEFSRAGAETGDRFWRFPLWKHYNHRVKDYVGVDVGNTGKGWGGDPCLAAGFLLEFVPPIDFVHIDISGSGLKTSGVLFPYLRKGSMTGRPTRGLIQFFYQLACPHHRTADDCCSCA